MKIIIDGEEREFELEQENNLSDIIKNIYMTVTKSKKAIAEIQLNGALFTGNESIAEKIPISEINTLNITTCSPRDLAIAILYESARHMPRLADGISAVSTFLQARDLDKAMSMLQQCAGAWMDINAALSTVEQATGIDSNIVMVKDKSMAILHSEILHLLRHSLEALEKDDIVHLSDLFEYELAPKIKEEEEAIYEMISIAERQLN